MTVDPDFHGYSPAQARTYFEALRIRLNRLPGVASMSLASNPPLGHSWTVVKTNLAGRSVNIHYNNGVRSFFGPCRSRWSKGAVYCPATLARSLLVARSLVSNGPLGAASSKPESTPRACPKTIPWSELPPAPGSCRRRFGCGRGLPSFGGRSSPRDDRPRPTSGPPEAVVPLVAALLTACLGTVLLAALLPGRRALLVDPMRALRYD